MKSLKELYRMGPGPSSSHTIGPQRCAKVFLQRYPNADYYVAHLYGSLSMTGKGHFTDKIIMETFEPLPCKVVFEHEEPLKHPNTLTLEAFRQNECIGSLTFYSVGGGAIRIEGEPSGEGKDIYPHHFLNDILKYCRENGMELWEYVNTFDPMGDYMDQIMQQMLDTVERGLSEEGLLPGKLQLERMGKALYEQAQECRIPSQKEKLLLCSYAYAACEENAAGHMTVTAPTLGSSGILPAVVTYFYKDLNYPRQKIRNGLKIAGLIGNIIKENATISGAQGGCQAEVGAAISMAAAMCAYLQGCDNGIIEYAAEIGMEHHLGLTCDPVGGYVMIPCIERNAVGVLRAFDASLLAQHLSMIRREHTISFDMVVNTMNYTGKKIPIELRETSLGGLAAVLKLH